MGIDWSKLVRQPQTYGLVVGVGIGSALLLGLAGPRPPTWLAGGGITVTMLVAWTSGFRTADETIDQSSNLLEASIFRARLQQLETRVPHTRQATWDQAKIWASESQQFAERIYRRDSLLQVELLEAMHQVLNLSQQVAEALQVMDQIETPAYQQLAQQRLQDSCDRLQDSHAQLQQLQDQVALSSLDPASSTSSLPQRLQTLIDANQQILEANRSDRA